MLSQRNAGKRLDEFLKQERKGDMPARRQTAKPGKAPFVAPIQHGRAGGVRYWTQLHPSPSGSSHPLQSDTRCSAKRPCISSPSLPADDRTYPPKRSRLPLPQEVLLAIRQVLHHQQGGASSSVGTVYCVGFAGQGDNREQRAINHRQMAVCVCGYSTIGRWRVVTTVDR